MSGQPNIDGTRRVLILMQEIEALEKERTLLETAAKKLPDVEGEHRRKLFALEKELQAMDVQNSGNFGHYLRLAQFLNQVRIEIQNSLVRDATKEEPPERRVLVWDEGEWRMANYNRSRSSSKGDGRLPNASYYAQWHVENTEGGRHYRWWIDIAAVKPPTEQK